MLIETNKKENITPPEDRMNGVISLEGLAEAYYEWSQLIGLENRLRSAIRKGQFDEAKKLIDQYRIDPTVFL